MSMSDTKAILYGCWASSCSWRVRAVLHYKQIPFEERNIDIFEEKKQLTDEYKAINPMQKVPALVIGKLDAEGLEGDCFIAAGHITHDPVGTIDGETLVESMAIIQYLEDTRPYPPLMPTTPLQRARARGICEIIVSGIQPLQSGLRHQLASEEQYTNFAKYWIVRGLQTLEEVLKKSARTYSVGDNVSLADICLVPQVFNAVTIYKVDLKKYATVSKVYNKLLDEDLFQETHPKKIKPIV